MADDVIRDPVRSPVGTGTRTGDRLNFQKVSWGAIWAGVMVTIGLEALFLSFGVFIAALFGGSTDWAMAWYLVTMAVAFYFGARSAARLSDLAVREVCVLHAAATWGLATLGTALIGGTLGWAAFVKTGVAFSASLWGPTEQWAGIIWGGIILSLAAAYFGGASARPIVQAGAVPDQEGSVPPLRRVS